MMAAGARTTSLLEKLIENVPNCNSSSVKKERKDFQNLFQSSSTFGNDFFPTVGTFPPVAQPPPPPPQPVNLAVVKLENTIDSPSIQGSWGWVTINGVSIPMIMRNNGINYIPVRIVESMIIQPYSEGRISQSVFKCINIHSDNMTQNEAKLLNEINKDHCDYLFGYEPFINQDVILKQEDVISLSKFLEASREIFSLQPVEWLGFISISGSVVAPFISKKSPVKSDDPNSATELRRYVPQSLVQQKVVIARVEKLPIGEWDLSYLKMLMIYAGNEGCKFDNDYLCCVSDLKWDVNFCPVEVQEIDLVKMRARSSSNYTYSGRSSSSYVQPSTSHHSHPSTNHHSQPSSASSSASQPAKVTHLHPPQHCLDPSLNDPWMRMDAAGSPNTTLRSLHQVSLVEVSGVTLTAINLKSYSTQQAVFISEAVNKIFRDSSKILITHYILEKILQVKLYDYTRLHEDAFLRSGVRPLRGDKLILVEILRKVLSQLRQIMMAGAAGLNV